MDAAFSHSQTARILGLSRHQLSAFVAKHQFPVPVELPGSRAYRAEDVLAIRDRLLAGDQLNGAFLRSARVRGPQPLAEALRTGAFDEASDLVAGRFTALAGAGRRQLADELYALGSQLVYREPSDSRAWTAARWLARWQDRIADGSAGSLERGPILLALLVPGARPMDALQLATLRAAFALTCRGEVIDLPLDLGSPVEWFGQATERHRRRGLVLVGHQVSERQASSVQQIARALELADGRVVSVPRLRGGPPPLGGLACQDVGQRFAS